MFHPENDSDHNLVAVEAPAAAWVKPVYRQISAGSAESFGDTAADGDFTSS